MKRELEGVIHTCLVDDLPHLQLADLHGRVVVVTLVDDEPIVAMKRHARAKSNDACGLEGLVAHLFVDPDGRSGRELYSPISTLLV